MATLSPEPDGGLPTGSERADSSPSSSFEDAALLASSGGILLTMQSFSQGGGDRVAVILANGFARAGIPTRLVLMRDAGEAECELLCLLHPDVTVRVAGAPLKMPFAGIRERFRGIRHIRRQINEFRPAIVLAASDNMALATALACPRHAERPLFALKLTNRLFRPHTGRLRMHYRRRLFGFIFDRADLVLTLSEAERSYVRLFYPEKAASLRTVSNPYVTDRMLSARRLRRSGGPHFLSAGRMVRQKRFDLLLRAFALLSNKEATLTILGDGPLRPSLVTLARSLGIECRVQMPGFATDIIPALLEADLFIMSSDYEGLPAVLIEAMACNVPVITTDSFLAAFDLLSDAEPCLVVSLGNAPGLARAIEYQLERGLNPTDDLRNIARSYTIDASVAAHVSALAAAFLMLRRSEVSATIAPASESRGSRSARSKPAKA